MSQTNLKFLEGSSNGDLKKSLMVVYKSLKDIEVLRFSMTNNWVGVYLVLKQSINYRYMFWILITDICEFISIILIII